MIEFRAREDWTASRIALWITVLEKPSVGASLSFDLSPEIAERLAQDLLSAVKRYRGLDASVEKDLAPRNVRQKGCRVRLKANRSVEGVIARDNDGSDPLPITWDSSSVSALNPFDGQDIEVIQ